MALRFVRFSGNVDPSLSLKKLHNSDYCLSNDKLHQILKQKKYAVEMCSLYFLTVSEECWLATDTLPVCKISKDFTYRYATSDLVFCQSLIFDLQLSLDPNSCVFDNHEDSRELIRQLIDECQTATRLLALYLETCEAYLRFALKS